MMSMVNILILGLSALVQKNGAFVLQQKDIDEGLQKDSLIRDLTATFRRGHDVERLLHFEDEVKPMFNSMSKNSHGNLGQATARRALHRLFLRRHGWSIEGLLPAEDENDDATPRSISTTWMPSFLFDAIEQLFGTKGVNVQELAVLAAAFEDLVHREAIGRLEEVYEWKNLSTDTVLEAYQSEDLIKTYMIMYTSGGNATVRSKEHLMKKKGALNRRTKVWLKAVERNVAEAESLCDMETGKCGQLDFKATTRVVEEIGEKYRAFNQGECGDLALTLLNMEDKQKPGHVLLSDFYKPGLHNSWNFTEKEDYLRALGTLDETDPAEPRVIIPNYIYSRPNCLAASEIYVVCCNNPCEDLMGKLENELVAPTATAEQIEKILPPASASPHVSLHDVADFWPAGKIPIHGTFFAQWLHEAYPLKCPRPLLSHATSHAKDSEDWAREFGLDSTMEQEAQDPKTEDSSSEVRWPQNPIIQEQDDKEVKELLSFEWLRSFIIFAFMACIALFKSSSKGSKRNWNQLWSAVMSRLTRNTTTLKQSEMSTARDGNWV